jgi:exosome complex RNA-binding protein Rrp42 (RNase PH superfamily)
MLLCYMFYFTQADGNLLDAASFASYVALNTALVPNVIVIASESTGLHDDFEIDGDLALADHIQGASMVSALSSYVYNQYF